jgi:hypothetical protein
MAVIIACNRVNDDACAFIESVYSNYGSDESTFAFNGPGADTLFAPTLLHLIRLDQQRAQGEVGYLDGDPLCACQDSRGLRVDGIRIKSRSDTTIAEVSIRFGTDSKCIVLKLDNTKGKWLIGDIVDTTITPHSLVDFLSDRLKE